MDQTEPASIATGRLDFGFAGEGNLRWAAADLGQVLETVRSRLDLSPVAAAALGRSLAGASLLMRLGSRKLRRLTLEVRGDGPLGRVLAEADRDGNLRGTVGDPRVDVPPTPHGKLAVGKAVGKGLLRVVREEADDTYQSQVEIATGEIGEDLAHFLVQSEQTNCAVLVGVLAVPTGIASAGGIIVEVLPGTPDPTLDTLERNVERLGSVSHVLADRGLDGLRETLFAELDPQIHDSTTLRYLCRCSRGRLAQQLATLSAADRAELVLADGLIEAECMFCGEVYRYGTAELDAGDGDPSATP